MNMVNSGKNTPFHYLCRYWNDKDTIIDIMTRFVHLGADVNAQTDSTGETPLFKVRNAMACDFIFVLNSRRLRIVRCAL